MKWLKHIPRITDHTGTIRQIINEHGPEYYGYFWICIELVSLDLDDHSEVVKGEVPKTVIHVKDLQWVFNRSIKWVDCQLQKLSKLGAIRYHACDIQGGKRVASRCQYRSIGVPNLLKFVDIYLENRQFAAAQNRTEKEQIKKRTRTTTDKKQNHDVVDVASSALTAEKSDKPDINDFAAKIHFDDTPFTQEELDRFLFLHGIPSELHSAITLEEFNNLALFQLSEYHLRKSSVIEDILRLRFKALNNGVSVAKFNELLESSRVNQARDPCAYIAGSLNRMMQATALQEAL